MAITRTAKTSGSSSTDGANGPASMAFTASAGDLVLYYAHWSRSGAAPDTAVPVFTPSTGTTATLTFSLLGFGGVDAARSYFTSNGRRVSVWGAIATETTIGTVQQVLTNTHDGFMYGIDTLQNVDLSGGISGVLVQSPALNSAGSGTSLSLTLGSAPQSDSFVMSFFGVSASGSVAFTPDTDFTTSRNVTAISSPSLRFWIASNTSVGAGGNTSIGGSIDSSSNWAAVGLEFKAAPTTLTVAATGSELTIESGAPSLLAVFNSLIGLRIRWP